MPLHLLTILQHPSYGVLLTIVKLGPWRATKVTLASFLKKTTMGAVLIMGRQNALTRSVAPHASAQDKLSLQFVDVSKHRILSW